MGSASFVPCLLLSAALATAQAPPGYKIYENKQAPLQFFYPVAYQEIPLPPTEQLLVAKFLMKNKPEELKRVDDRLYKAIEQQIHVFRFEIPGAQTASGGEKKPDDEGGRPTTVKEAMEQGSRVSSWDEFTKRYGNWRFEEDPKKPGFFALRFRGEGWPLRDIVPIGYLVKKQQGQLVFGVYGFSLSPCEKTLQTNVTKMAGGMTLSDEDADDAADAAIDKLYASGKYSAVEKRKQARAAMSRGWRAVDTEHYLIVHHSKNTGLINQIAREIEAMRALYTELFPPKGTMDALSVVRVCRTQDEYHQYGGPPSTGGYWHPGNEELVFYDYSYTMKTLDDKERKMLGGHVMTDADSMLVLYHEAFHQYIYYAIGEFAPHDWFNEGYGDFFSGAVVPNNTNRVVRIDPSPWRIHRAKDMCEFNEGFIPLKDILEAERAQFYNPAKAGFYYAGAWSFVYFLKNSKEAAANPRWASLLADYLANVTTAYGEEIKKFGENPDLEKKTVAGFLARKAALKKTLEGIDLDELEKVWKKWVVDMRDPWPSQRKKHK